MNSNCYGENECPVETALRVVGGKYKVVIIYHLRDRALRFSELQKLIPEATAKTLTKQLRELENDFLISRKVYAVIPPKTEYSLTPLGKTLLPVLNNICEWGGEYIRERYTLEHNPQRKLIVSADIPNEDGSSEN
ncbi:winged helix-turn-helix transcriptional regulator [Succinimonas amylolytica]|uniref:winged helix-turn-helix transcriptional regulator n=1 Tax=Succinimonas amylolytica TaxID=83769 RepID=UPI00038170EB|nr:helix-turn-helix domain-containing protein [Succinimonas amylolytica]